MMQNATCYYSSGVATRLCNANGEWEEANVLECTTIAFIELEQLVSVTLTSTTQTSTLLLLILHHVPQAETAITSATPEEQIMQTNELTDLLIEATEPQNRSLLPNDLQASTRILTTVLEVLENNDNATTNLVCLHHVCRNVYVYYETCMTNRNGVATSSPLLICFNIVS